MTEDPELDVFRQAVNCAAVLERMTGGWKLDVSESTRRALKYRRGAGEIIIVNRDGRGWWDATGRAKGDVFTLVQHLEPSLNFGQVRKLLRGFVGIAPTYPASPRKRASAKADRTPAERWAKRGRLNRGDAAWRHLTSSRVLPARVLIEAARQDVVRSGAYGSAWFAHLSQGQVTHVEIRSPTFKGPLKGGRKTLFRFGEAANGFIRLAVLEAPIDALRRRMPRDADLSRLFEARRADTGEAWSKHSRKLSGFDLVFSPDKSVTLAVEFALTPSESAGILNALDRANDGAMRYVAQVLGWARKGQGGDDGADPGAVGWIKLPPPYGQAHPANPGRKGRADLPGRCSCRRRPARTHPQLPHESGGH
jgi:hypothetical protein